MSDEPIQDGLTDYEKARAIAVVGMSGRFPGSRDLAELWRNLEAGVEAMRPLSEEELLAAGVPREVFSDPAYVRMASRLEDVDAFDAGFFGYTPREAEILDPQQRLFLENAWAALEDAGYAPGRYEGLIGIYAGVAWNTYLLSNLVSHPRLFDGGGGFQVFISNDKDFLPTRASYKLNLKGPSLIIQTSCSTSLVAVHVAALSLLNYECDIALVGGVTVRVPQDMGYLYQDGGLASPDGHCRAFDAQAAGTVFGSGVGVVALKRYSEAVADGDSIRAVILGSAINNDGSVKVSYTAPSVEGQAEVIAAAQAVAGVDPESITYVEAHGTGTSLGDPIEVAALTRAFGETSTKRGWCGLGSIKTNVGHLDAAAGVAGFLKTVLALQHRRLPPSLHYERPNPKIDFASSPFYVVTEARDWPADGGPRRAGVSSFGVGGTNAHVILEEAPPAEKSAPSRPQQLLLLSARTPEALDRTTRALGERLGQDDAPDLADAAYTLQVGRTVFEQRRILVATSAEDASAALLADDPARLLTELDAPEPGEKPVAFLFPGQGAQHPGMAAELYRTEETFRAEVDRCCRILEPHLGLDLRRLIHPPEGTADAAATLERTEYAQPALFVVEYALARLWMEWGIAPRALLGHSIGEYVAACLAGVFSLEDALRLVAARGRLMQSLPSGAMTAVPLPADEVRPLLSAELSPLSIAAVNEPERCVVSGPEEAIAALEEQLAAQGLAPRRLHTSHAFHSGMMEPILEPFRAELRKVRLQPPSIPYLSNLTGTWVTEREATDPESWVRHLRQAVLFAQGLETLVADASPILLEVGPGRTLTTLARRQAGGRPVIASLPHPQDESGDLASVLTALGRLWMAGREIDWSGFHARERRRRVPLPTYPFERERYWIAPAERQPQAAARPALPGGLEKKADPADWFYLPSWRRTLAPAPSTAWAETPRRWWILDDGTSLGARIAERLRVAGQEVAVYAYGAPLEGEPRPDVVLHLWTLAGSESSMSSGFERGYASLLPLGRLLADPGAPVRLEIVGQGLLAVTGAEPVSPDLAALLGAARVLPQELPHVACRTFDIQLPAPGSSAEAALVDRLLSELGAPAAEREIALRGGERWVEDVESVRVDQRGIPVPERGAVLVAGRVTGAGLALARSLARERNARLAFVLPPEEAARAELQAAGAEVLLFPAEPSDEIRLAQVLVEIRERFGPLDAVISTSWIEEGRMFRPVGETGPEDSRAHFAQAQAVRTLDRLVEATWEQPERPACCLLLATVASVLGGLGYAAHASSCRWLAAFARESRRRGRLPWTCVDLDAWQTAGAEVTQVSATLARLALSEEEGAAAVWRAVSAGLAGLDRVVVSTADLPARVAAGLRRAGGPEEAAGERSGAAVAGTRHARPRLPTPYAPPASDLEGTIARIWGAALGFEEVGVHDNFFELGGDSFAAVQVISRLRAELGRDVAVTKLYQGLTVRSLAALLEQDGAAAAEQRAAQLEERREAMDRRQQFLERRRAGKRVTGRAAGSQPAEVPADDWD